MLPMSRAAAASFALAGLAVLAGCGPKESTSSSNGAGGPAAASADACATGDAACEIACETEKLAPAAPAAPATAKAPAAPTTIPVAAPGQRLVYTVHADGAG